MDEKAKKNFIDRLYTVYDNKEVSFSFSDKDDLIVMFPTYNKELLIVEDIIKYAEIDPTFIMDFIAGSIHYSMKIK